MFANWIISLFDNILQEPTVGSHFNTRALEPAKRSNERVNEIIAKLGILTFFLKYSIYLWLKNMTMGGCFTNFQNLF